MPLNPPFLTTACFEFLSGHSRYLELVGLYAFCNYLPGEISGGIKQRLALGRVLSLEAEILLMDEPFAALDAQTREEMHQLLLRLWRELSHTISLSSTMFARQ